MDANAYEGNFIEISTQALEENAKTVCAYVGVPVIGVVKLDGYGVTPAVAARAWQKAGVTMFAVAESAEALALREAGITEDILLMSPVADAQSVQKLLDGGIILAVGDLTDAARYLQYSENVRVHIKVDTGMGRFGIRWDDKKTLEAVYAQAGLRIEGIFSHFASSFEKEYKQTKLQLARFMEAVQAVEQAGFQTGMRHIANSCAALRFPQTHLDAVRVGSALVGALPAAVPIKLQKAFACKAQVVALKRLKKGDTMGYASICKAKKDMTVAVVAIGQSYGFGTIAVPEATPVRNFVSYVRDVLRRYRQMPCVKVNGKALPMVGRLGSQYTLFDASGAEVQPGDYVQIPISILHYQGARKYI